MSTERPTKKMLVFQCEACFDTHEFNKDDGDPIHDFAQCWATLREEGWSFNKSEHFCPDCTEIAKTNARRNRS